MNQDEIIEMARHVGFSETDGLFRTLYISSPSDIQAFAKLVAAKEREACAIACEADGRDLAGLYYAGVIRARGERQ